MYFPGGGGPRLGALLVAELPALLVARPRPLRLAVLTPGRVTGLRPHLREDLNKFNNKSINYLY